MQNAISGSQPMMTVAEMQAQMDNEAAADDVSLINEPNRGEKIKKLLAEQTLNNPETVAGTLLCGTNQDSQPMVAWTTTSTLLLATIRADTPQKPSLEQLYTWWSSHS